MLPPDAVAPGRGSLSADASLVVTVADVVSDAGESTGGVPWNTVAGASLDLRIAWRKTAHQDARDHGPLPGGLQGYDYYGGSAYSSLV